MHHLLILLFHNLINYEDYFQTKIELLLKMGSGADDGRDHVFGGLCNKIPGRLRRSTAFLISIPLLRKRASGCKQKIPFLRDAQEEDFIEVGGGFEPPCSVLQTAG